MYIALSTLLWSLRSVHVDVTYVRVCAWLGAWISDGLVDDSIARAHRRYRYRVPVYPLRARGFRGSRTCTCRQRKYGISIRNSGNAHWSALFGTNVYYHNSVSHMTAKGAAMIIRTDSSKYDQVSSFWSHSLLHAMTNGSLRH